MLDQASKSFVLPFLQPEYHLVILFYLHLPLLGFCCSGVNYDYLIYQNQKDSASCYIELQQLQFFPEVSGVLFWLYLFHWIYRELFSSRRQGINTMCSWFVLSSSLEMGREFKRYCTFSWGHSRAHFCTLTTSILSVWGILLQPSSVNAGSAFYHVLWYPDQ